MTATGPDLCIALLRITNDESSVSANEHLAVHHTKDHSSILTRNIVLTEETD